MNIKSKFLDILEGRGLIKRVISTIIFVVSCVLLIGSLAFCVYSIVDVNCTLNELDNTHGVSAADYFGIGWAYGICLFGASTFGLILSMICKKILKQKVLQYILIVSICIFVLLLVISIVLFYI